MTQIRYHSMTDTMAQSSPKLHEKKSEKIRGRIVHVATENMLANRFFASAKFKWRAIFVLALNINKLHGYKKGNNWQNVADQKKLPTHTVHSLCNHKLDDHFACSSTRFLRHPILRTAQVVGESRSEVYCYGIHSLLGAVLIDMIPMARCITKYHKTTYTLYHIEFTS